jgi:hypothetical protein
MARRKWTSMMLEKAELRASGINSIGPDLNLGTDLTLPSFWDSIHSLRNLHQEDNPLLSSVDRAYNKILVARKSLGDQI